MQRRFIATLAAALLALGTASAFASDYRSKPVSVNPPSAVSTPAFYVSRRVRPSQHFRGLPSMVSMDASLYRVAFCSAKVAFFRGAKGDNHGRLIISEMAYVSQPSFEEVRQGSVSTCDEGI